MNTELHSLKQIRRFIKADWVELDIFRGLEARLQKKVKIFLAEYNNNKKHAMEEQGEGKDLSANQTLCRTPRLGNRSSKVNLCEYFVASTRDTKQMGSNIDKALPEISAHLSRDLLEKNETGYLDVGEWVWFENHLLPVNHPRLQSLGAKNHAHLPSRTRFLLIRFLFFLSDFETMTQGTKIRWLLEQEMVFRPLVRCIHTRSEGSRKYNMAQLVGIR